MLGFVYICMYIYVYSVDGFKNKWKDNLIEIVIYVFKVFLYDWYNIVSSDNISF